MKGDGVRSGHVVPKRPFEARKERKVTDVADDIRSAPRGKETSRRQKLVLAGALFLLALLGVFAVGRMGFTAVGFGEEETFEEFVNSPRAEGSIPAGSWKQVGDEWYCEASDGSHQTGWVDDGAHWYYLRPFENDPTPGPEGSMVVGWAKIGVSWYYFDPDGAMHKGRLFYEGNEYYMGDENVEWYIHGSVFQGAMLTGLVGFGHPLLFSPYTYANYYCEGPCLQLFQSRSFPEGALVKDCSFVDWGMFSLGNWWEGGTIDGLGEVKGWHFLRLVAR